jgi:hypothetical protein
MERKAGVALNQSPDEAGGEKAVVESLVGGEHRRVRCLLDRVTKGLQAQRFGPEKHLQNQKIDLQRCDQRHQPLAIQIMLRSPGKVYLPGQAARST